MQQQHYKAGDQVNLRSNFAGVRSVQSLCRIVSVLPASDSGESQYKVRFENEKFDRRVLASDIEAKISIQPVAGLRTPASGGWLNASRIKVSK
ncbi:cold-shock protein [Hoeflea sp. CAU 1731]